MVLLWSIGGKQSRCSEKNKNCEWGVREQSIKLMKRDDSEADRHNIKKEKKNRTYFVPDWT